MLILPEHVFSRNNAPTLYPLKQPDILVAFETYHKLRKSQEWKHKLLDVLLTYGAALLLLGGTVWLLSRTAHLHPFLQGGTAFLGVVCTIALVTIISSALPTPASRFAGYITATQLDRRISEMLPEMALDTPGGRFEFMRYRLLMDQCWTLPSMVKVTTYWLTSNQEVVEAVVVQEGTQTPFWSVQVLAESVARERLFAEREAYLAAFGELPVVE